MDLRRVLGQRPERVRSDHGRDSARPVLRLRQESITTGLPFLLDAAFSMIAPDLYLDTLGETPNGWIATLSQRLEVFPKSWTSLEQDTPAAAVMAAIVAARG